MDSVVSLTEFAPAKVNLALHVTGRRADGYHLLDSLVVFTRFGDRLAVEAAVADSFAVDGPFADDVPVDGGNLAVRARDALRSFALDQTVGRGVEDISAELCPPVSIRLTKNLPVASGVGGGSSDAAAVLKALVRLWRLDIGDAALAPMALSLGADVPMCLAARPLLARGIGDEIAPLAGFPSLGLVLVTPRIAVSTAKIFDALQSRDNAPLPPLPRQIDFHSLRNWLETTRNDLEQPARTLHPGITVALAALRKADAGFARMSGSGATCFGLFETGNVAKRAAAEIRGRHPGWFVAATRTLTSEPEADGQA